MEVKPSVVEIAVLQLLVETSELVTNPFLRSFFVNKIHKILLVVHRLCVLKMEFCCHFRVQKVLLDLNWRRPFEIWLHAPNERNRSSYLDIACNIHVILFKLHKNVFCFSKICSISLSVKTSANKSSSWSPAVLSGYKIEISFGASLKRWGT